MATKITIDTNLIAGWTTGTSYRIAITPGLVDEVGGNRFKSPGITTATSWTSFQTGPYVDSTVPTYGSTSLLSTATLHYVRPIQDKNTTSTNFYLYNENGDVLVATIPVNSSRVTRNGQNVNVDFTDYLEPERTYYLTSDAAIYKDLFNFNSVAISDASVFKYTAGPAAGIITITPSYGQTGSYVGSATIVYDRVLTKNTGSYYLNRASGPTMVKQMPVTGTGTSVVFIGTNTVKLTFNDVILPEDDYYITADQGVFKDQYRLPSKAISDTNTIKWSQLSISNMIDRTYSGTGQALAFFSTSTPVVLDGYVKSGGTVPIYTFKISSPLGSFNASAGYRSGNFYIIDGNKETVNTYIPSLTFTPTTTATSATTYDYSLEVDGVPLVSKTKNLTGVKFRYNGTGTVTLVGSNPITGYAYAFEENKLVYSTTGTNVTGYVKFYQSNTATSNFIGSATFVSKSATLPFIPAKTMNLNTGSSFHNFIAVTQDLTIDGIGYYSTTSSKTGTILPYILSIALSTSTITVADPVLVTNNWGVEVNTSTGQLEILDGTNVITTTTMDLNQVISVVQLPAGTFTAGEHTVKNSYKGAKTPITSSTSLTVNARGNYPGTLTLSGLSSTYQLDYQTYTLTSDYNTSTTGTVYLQQVSGTTVVNIATGTFNSNSINFNVPFDRFFVDASQEVRVYWEGQDWTPNVYYPYNAKYSNTLSQTVTLATVAFTPSTSTVSKTSPFQVIGTVNTSSSLVTTANITFQAKKNIITYSTLTVTSTNLSVVTQQSSTTTYNMATTGTVGHRYFWSVYVNSQPSYTRRYTATNVLSTTSWINGVDYGVTLGDNTAYQSWPVTSSTFGVGYDNTSYWIKVNDIKNITTGSVVLVDAFIKYNPTYNNNYFRLVWSPGNQFAVNSERLYTNAPYQVMRIYSAGLDEHYLWLKIGYSQNPWYTYPGGFDGLADPPYSSTYKYWSVEGGNEITSDILQVYLYSNVSTNPYIKVRLAGTQYGAYQPQVSYNNSLTATLGTSSVVVNTATVAVSSGTLPEFTGTWVLDGYMNIGTLTVPSTTGTVIIT